MPKTVAPQPGSAGSLDEASAKSGPDPLVIRATKERRRRNAGRRVSPTSAPPPSSSPLAGEDRGGGAARVQRDAPPVGVPPRHLLSEPTPQLSSGYALPGTRRVTLLACPSPASSSQAGHSAGRAYSRSRPGTELRSRPRGPLPLRLQACLRKASPSERDFPTVAEMVTNVNREAIRHYYGDSSAARVAPIERQAESMPVFKLARCSRISRSLSSGRPLRAGPVGSSGLQALDPSCCYSARRTCGIFFTIKRQVCSTSSSVNTASP